MTATIYDLIWIVLIAIVIILYDCKQKKKSDGPKSVELNGDSILFGLGLKEKPSEIIKRLRPDWTVDDRSASGLTLVSFYNGYKEPYLNADKSVFPKGEQPPFDELVHESDYIVIEFGGNDAYVNTSLEEFRQKLNVVVDSLLAQNKTPVLTGIVKLVASPPFDDAVIDRANKINTIVREIAKDKGVIYAFWDEEPFRGVEDTIDGIHRTQEMTLKLVDRLITSIEKNTKL